MELTGRFYLTPTIYNAYEKDTFGPKDKRFVQNSGPFTLAPDSVAPLVVGVMGGLDSAQIVKNADKAQDIFDAGFLAPYPPFSPHLTAIPGDHRVTLVWDNYSEITPDPFYKLISDTIQKRKYRPYDTEGYRVYKARSLADLSDLTKQTRLANFDLIDGFTIVKDAQYKFFHNPSGQTESLSVWDTLGTDSGIRYTFTDSGQVQGDSLGVVNGLPYFYGVTGFDYQYYDSAGKAWPNNPTSLEGSASANYVIAIPRTDPSNVATAAIDSNGFATAGGAYPGVATYSPRVAASASVINHTYAFLWNPVQKDTLLFRGTEGIGGIPLYSFTIRDSSSRQDLSTVRVFADTTTGWAGRPEKVPVFNGIAFEASYSLTGSHSPTGFKAGTMTVPPSYTDTVFADTILNLPSLPFTPMKWSARGALFKITWQRTGGSTGDSLLTITVRDSTNRVDIPFEGGKNAPALTQSSWAFGVDPDSVGYQYIDSVACSGAYSPAAAKKRARWLYLCGFRYLFNFHTISGSKRPDKMVWARRPANGDVWNIQQAGPKPPVDGNWLVFTPKAQGTTAGGKALLDAIKVVPNPYLVMNGWDTNRQDKHLMFTHLPTKCTIRIYTLAGNLVKIIYHDGNQNSFSALGGTTPVGGTGGTEFWNLLTYNSQLIASGVYLFHVEAPGIGNKIGKFAVIQ
jgi:hypothetical protein